MSASRSDRTIAVLLREFYSLERCLHNELIQSSAESAAALSSPLHRRIRAVIRLSFYPPGAPYPMIAVPILITWCHLSPKTWERIAFQSKPENQLTVLPAFRNFEMALHRRHTGENSRPIAGNGYTEKSSRSRAHVRRCKVDTNPCAAIFMTFQDCTANDQSLPRSASNHRSIGWRQITISRNFRGSPPNHR